jgi:hypothetical protein
MLRWEKFKRPFTENPLQGTDEEGIYIPPVGFIWLDENGDIWRDENGDEWTTT